MADQAPTTVTVNYRNVDGYHIFTSDQVFGLYVATKHAERAVAALQPSLELLLAKNYGVNCRLEPAAEFGEFVAHHRAGSNMPPALADKTFVVRRAA